MATVSNFFKLLHLSDNKSNNGLADGYGKHRPICLPLQKAQKVYLRSSDCFERPSSFDRLDRLGGRPRALGRQWDPGGQEPFHGRLHRPTPMGNKNKFIIIHSNMICIALTATISVLKYFLPF